MGAILSLLLSLLCLGASFGNIRNALSLFLITTLFAPYIVVGTVYIRIELFLVPMLVGVMILRNGTRAIYLPSLLWPLTFLWAYTLFLTLFSSVIGTAISPAWLNAYAYLRPILLIILFVNAGFSEDEFGRLLLGFTGSSIPLALLAIGQTFGVTTATGITLNAYMSPGRPVVERMVEDIGFILRAVSVFETPAYAATYFLLTTATSIYLLFELRSHRATRRAFVLPFVALFSSLAGGAVTLSATFVAGLTLILLMLFLRLERPNKLRAIFVSVILGALIFGYLLFLGKHEEYASIANNITYQVRRVISLELFETRYARNTGYLTATIREITENPLVGYGWVRKPGVFIGDSMYVVLLYQSGIIGLSLFLGWTLIAYRFIASRRIIRDVFLSWLFILLISGVGSPSFFIPRLNDWWWALCGIAASLVTPSQIKETS